jgi:hypothetical protein
VEPVVAHDPAAVAPGDVPGLGIDRFGSVFLLGRSRLVLPLEDLALERLLALVVLVFFFGVCCGRCC